MHAPRGSRLSNLTSNSFPMRIHPGSLPPRAPWGGGDLVGLCGPSPARTPKQSGAYSTDGGGEQGLLCSEGASSLVYGRRRAFGLQVVWENHSGAPQSLWARSLQAAWCWQPVSRLALRGRIRRNCICHPCSGSCRGAAGSLGKHHSIAQFSSKSHSTNLLGWESRGCGGRNSRF